MEPLKTSLVSEEQSSTEIDDRHYSLQDREISSGVSATTPFSFNNNEVINAKDGETVNKSMMTHAEQEDTQKRTFTSWVNSQLEKHSSPSLILDLYSDIGKGHVLLDLLEVLSGQQLPREKGSNTFQCRSNIENALTFLKNRSIEELAKALTCGYSQPSLDSSSTADSSPAPSPTARINVKARERWKISAKKAVLLWAKEQCDKHGSISVADFKSSWRNGLAFLAIIHALRPGLVDVEKAKGRSNKENLREAFQIAEKELNIPRLLEPEDVDVPSPDEKSIMTYVAQFLQYFKSLPVAEDKMQGKVKETLSWLNAQECKLTKLLTELENASFYKKFEAMLSFTETFNEEKKAFLPILESKRKLSELDEDYVEMKEARNNLSSQMNEWKAKLDNLLPPPLYATEAWLKETEQHLARSLPISQDHLKAMAALEEKMRAIQNLMESFQQHLETLQSFENRDNAGMLLVPPQKLEEMRKRFSKVQLENFGIFVEYYCLASSAVFKELTSKLNIWNIKFGTKETVKLLLLDWHNFIEEKGFLGQLDTALQVCEAQKNKMIQAPNLGADPEETIKLFKMIEAQISKCREYINNVNDTLKKVLSSWATYTENIHLLKTWLEETRKDHPKKISTETLAAWNSRHGSLNEAGNLLIESSNAEVGSAVSGELKKLNRKWAKLIKKTKFEMKLLKMQEEEMMLVTDNNGNVESSMKFNPDMFNNPVEPSKKPLKMCFEKAEIFPVSLHADPCIPEEFFSEDEVKLNFEKAHKELEASILKAMQLVGQKTNSEEPHSKYEEAFSILDTNILSKFLKAAEQLKSILSAHEKALVEERSKDVCERWEAVRCEIMSYIHLKLKIEREKLNKTFSNLTKQINKEKKLLNAGKTKGLIEEHEAFFSQQGGLGELNTCLQALKTMCEKMTKVEKESKIKLPIAEYEQKKKELQKRAATIYNELVSRTGDEHSSEKGDFTRTSVNEEKVSSQNPEAEKDSEDVSCINFEPEKEFQDGGHQLEGDGDLALKRLKESYDTARHNLKLHLSSIRENITPPLTDDVTNISSLQKKLETLEALESKGDSSWKLFDSVTSQLVKLSSEMDDPVTSEKSLEDLHKEWDELQFALDKRKESLKAALALVLPIENEWVLLCRSEEQLCKRDIPRCVMNKTDLLYKKMKKIQASIANCIEQCNSQEQNSPADWTIDQRDRQAIGLMISEYKMRLEELSQKIQVIETVLQDLETFLASLKCIQCSEDVSTLLSCSPQPVQEISHMEKEAKSLDEKLKQLHICLVEAESGKKMSCEEFVAALLVKENPFVGSEAAAEFTQNQKIEEFSLKNNELFKNIQDIYDLISTIGLRDPTIPAIWQRWKLLSELWKKLDRCAPEMKTLNEIISQISQLPKAQENEVSRQWGLTQDLWEKTKLAITEKREHCESTMELLKQCQSCKTRLTSIILKQESALSQQASYMGKENLQKIIAKVNMAKEEFNNYSEDVDRLSQMCKNLQCQLNKMKSFEEPPFEKEANAIVDRWLDINERTENYCENLERALALWDKLLNLSNLIDEWSDAVQKNLEDGNLTEKELEELEADVLFQEKKLEEFDTKVDEIQYLLNGSEPPLELQVIKSSLLNKMELIRKHLPNKSVLTEANGNTTELKGDLDLAKTQIGMTESLLEDLSPSDTLEIFTKLEEIHQKILHQKQHVKLLQKGTGYLNPDVIELKKQLKSITELFNSKKQIFQDHFTTLLNYQCKHFEDWFNTSQISLEKCFDSPETKEVAEEKIHQLMSFLNFEGKGNDIDEVKTVLSQVKNYLSKANVNQLSSWVRDQEVELQRVISKCQAREIELHIFLQQFARLEKDFKSLEKWLRTQEEKLQEVQIKKTGLEHFYQILLKQREWFDSFDWRANYLKNSGFSNDEAVLESAQLVSRYKSLLSHVQKSLGVSQMYCAERKHFEELVRSIFCWVESLKKSVMELSATQSEISPEEKLFKMQEIALLKEEGSAKLQTITAVGENLKCDDKSKNLTIQQIVSDVQKKWDCTIHLVTDCLRDQEQLQHQTEQVKQTEDGTKTVFYEVGKQKQKLNVDLHPSSQDMQNQLNNYSALLKETEGLTSLLNELTRQRSSLEACANSFFSVESLMALQQLYKSLLSQLQNTTKLLEGCAEGHQQCEELTALLITSLEELLEPGGAEQKQVQCDILCQAEDRLQEVVALMDSLRLEQTCIKDEIDAPQIKQKYLKTKYGLDRETEDIHCDILKHNILTKKEVDNETTNTGKLENSFRVKNQMDREAPELFPEWLTSKVQLPSSLALESEERAASVIGQELKGNLMEAHNFQSSASQCAKQQQKSEQILADDYLNESPQQQHGYQKKLQATCGWSEMPQTILPLMNGKVIEADPTPLSIIHPSPESKQDYLEDQAIAEYAEMEQKVNKVKIWPAELDIVLMKDQLREIEDLYLQLEKQKAQALLLWQEHSTVAEGSKADRQDSHGVTSSSWDRLLQELMVIKEAKQNQFNLVNRYQECLATVQSSMKHLLAEKENMNTRGPMEDTALLENLNKLLASTQKETILLSKLKTEQQNISRHLSSLDRELIQSQVNQAEQWWKQMEDSLQKKQFCVAAEVDEFKRCMDKAQELQICLQQQCDSQTSLGTPGRQEHSYPILTPLELHILKHNISLLKRNAEIQMKRMWSSPGKTALENTINDLQSQVEELEQMTPKENVQITDSNPQTYEIRKEIEDAILGTRILMLHLDERAALFPDDLLLQMKCCKAVISDAEEKEQAFMRLAEEAHHVASHMPSKESSGLSILSHELQTGYQLLISKSSQRLQQLESQLGKREKLFANIEKCEAQLQEIKIMSSLDVDKTSLKSEYDHMQNLLEKTPKKIQEMEALVDANCNDSSEGLNTFEQLFLNDCSRSLRSRAKRVHRVIQIKGCLVQNKVDAYKKLSEEIKALQQDLSNLLFDELELDPEELLSRNQEIKDKLNMLKERTFTIQSRLSYLDQYQEIWKGLDLKWDTSPLEELKDQFCKAKNTLDKRVKCIKNLFAEYDRHQIVLSEIEATVSSIQKEYSDLKDLTSSTSETRLIIGKKLIWRVEHARYITQEAFKLFKKNKTFSASFKKANKQQIKSLEAKIDELEQMIRSMILANQEVCKYEQGFQSKLGHSLRTLKQIQSELQQPVLLDLNIQVISYEMMYCKVLKGAIEAEICAAEDIITKEKSSAQQTLPHPESLGKEIEEFQNLKIQLKADFAEHTGALDEAFKTVKLYNKAVEKTADLLSQCEAFLSTPLLSLHKLEESHLDFDQKQEESEAAKSEVEALTNTLKKTIKSKAKLQMEKILGDLIARNLAIREQSQKRNSFIQRYMEKYHSFKKSKEKISAELNNAEKVLWKSLYYDPVSYKEALEHSEQSKMLSSQLVSAKEDLMKLRRDSQSLSLMCKENDGVLIVCLVSMLWLKWLCLFNIAKEWEGKCEEQNQEWKSVSEELERETIILDNLQEELPESLQDKQQATKEELQEFLESASNYIENVDTEKLLLRLILCRLRNILSVPESLSGKEGLPIVCEIRNMQQRTEELCSKAQKEKEAVQSEIVYRTKCKEELKAMKTSLQGIISQLRDIDLEAPNEKALKLEEIQRVVDSKKQIMEDLRIKYTEIYRIVPVDIEMHSEDCKRTLHDLEEKVSTEFLKNSPHYSTEKKIEDINKGLQAVENMLQQKSENIAKAKEIQKRVWDLLDLWHYKMNELDSEVQDIVEQDPHQAQELMDRLMIPLQQYQQVSQHAEHRTTNLNRAASKMEECDELLKSTQVWLQNTSHLLTEEVKSDSAKALKKHASALEMALEDSEQKQSILSAISPELKELSPLIETDSMVQELTEVNEQVKALQQKITEVLPRIQHLADDVEVIESEVKMMEKDVEKIKTILSPSEDTLDFSPKEHLKHCKVILTHICPMQKALAEIQSYKADLRLTDMRMQPLSVFQRTKRLLKELKVLERITEEENTLLEPIVKEMEEIEQQIDFLKQSQFPKSNLDELSTEIPWPAQATSFLKGEEVERVKQQIALLCQQKEDILTTMKSALVELHQNQELPEAEDSDLESPEEDGSAVGLQPKKRGSLALLPSLVEEAEDGSFHNEEVDTDTTKAMGNEDPLDSPTKGKSSTQVTNPPECLWRSLSDTKATEDPVRPDSEPAQVLHVCQAQIAELELWLNQVKGSLGSEAQIGQMQQSVERHLAACQVMLSEIEQKVMWLLEDCKGTSTSNSSGLERETENLSLKLKDVKCKLEKVQGMLQDKYTEEQMSTDENFPQPLHFDSSSSFPSVTSDRPLFSRPNGLQHQQELLLKLSEQNNLIDFLEVYMEKIQPHPRHSTVLEPQTSHETVSSGNETLGLTPKDQTGDKWQYLQEELLFKKNAPHCQFDEPQISTKINILPLGATSSVRTPTVEELKTYTAQLDNLSQEASTQIQENETGENALSLDQKLFELLLAISRCLNNMEQMLGTCVLSSEEAPVQQVLYETLSAELQKLHTDIGDKKDDLLKSITSAGGNSERFSQCFSNLQAWLQLTQTAAASRSESMKTEMDHYINYQNEIRHLYDALIEKKSSLQQYFSGMSGHNISKQFQMDVFELELQNFERQAVKLRDHGERFHLPVAITHEVYKLEEVLDDLWEILRVKQKELSSSFINEQQYEALLQGLKELIDLGKGKLAHVSKLKITSQSDLHLHLQNHKSFFCKLNSHMLLVQKVAAPILQKKEKFWKDVAEEVKSLEEQAIQHGTHLENLLQDWIAFDENCVSFCQKLEALSPPVPFVTLVEETEERVMERTQLLQEIKKNIEGEQVRYYQIVKEGKNLIELLSCPELQCQVEKLEHQWISLSQRVDHELQKLETLHKLLSSYSKDSKELNVWLESAQQNVNYWKEQSLNASQDLNTVRNHIQSLLEFSKEIDDKSSLKSSVISTGNQLLLIKESDAAKLRSSLAECEQRWTNLVVQLPDIQEKFHQLQMAKLPSHEAITELNAWMNRIEQQRRNEVVINLQSPASQVKGLLRKYKEYVMEMNFKQWIVDYVNQSLLQLTPCDVESKRYERTSFAECLGEMNVNWHHLQGTLNGKIKELEHILESVVENENKAQSLGSWLEAQSRRLKRMKNPRSSILAQDTVKECKMLENQLTVKSKDVDQLKNNHTTLEDCADSAKKVVFTTNDLDEMRTSIINQVAQLKSSTQSVLECWKSYDEAWDEIRLMLANALYCLEHSKSPVITVKTLKKQVEDLQSLQDKAEGNREIWARLQTAAGNLKKLCDPSFSEIIEQKHKEARTRWILLNKNIEEKLQKAHTHLHLWESYTGLYNEVSSKLDKYEEQCDSQLMSDKVASYTMDFLKQKAQDVKKLQLGLQDIKEYFLQASEPEDKIAQLAELGTQPLLQEKLQPLQRISCLEKMLQMKADVFQYGLLQLENFGNSLEKLENQVKESTEILDNSCEINKDLDLLMSQLLSLTSLSPEMERLNEVSFKLPLCDFTVKRLQNLNRQWTQKTTMVLEQCSELQNQQSDDKKFLQQCQNWVQFLEKMKETLKENMAGTLEKLQEQQKEYEILQAEISINQQIFSSIVSKALHMLESGEAENRTEFISRLTLLKEQWQSVVRMAHRKKSDIDSLVKQWQKFTTLLQDLTKFLMDTNSYIAAMKSQDKYSLHQIRNLDHKFKNKEILQKRWQTRYSLILDTGEKLLGIVAPEAKAAIQLEMSQLQDNWDNTQLQLEKITRQFQGTIQTWESCERQVKDLGHALLELKGRINEPLPVEHDALQAAMEHVKALEKSLTNWSQNAKELDAKKVEMAHFILAEDVMVLKEQIEHLHSQWEELCLRVSLRKQDIEDQLNAWIVFNEKNKKLCAWLVQMEGKVLQSADISIEDMLEKLQKDCMEEINLFNESQLVHFKQMGDQLIKSSSKSRGVEIEEKLNKINDRWQHLFDVIGGRVKKLKETFAFIQQLDKNMSHLHTWLARIESELSKPIVYDICDDQEIQRRLAEQQDLQRDIEQHTAGVESVFNICEVLLHDSDACANETECDSIQQTTRSLERRWRNICAMSMERRMKIEGTWRLWQKFLEDYSRFEVWLKTAERTAAYPNSSEILYVNAKEELKKFEAFQRQIHERLTQLELINKQYRRLARENRTDSANKLKQMVYEGNHRWDNLQKRVTAILRRLKHFTNQWEEFMGTKDNMLVWLTEMDLQLTNVEHFSKSDFDDKLRQLNGFQREIMLNTNKIDQLIESGEYLIQKSEPEDAIILEEELEEFRSYCQEVFGRVARFHHRLTNWHPGLEDEKETSENEADSDHARGMRNDPWPKKTVQEVPPSQQSLCHLMPTAVGHERSGCETPVSVDSIPLEWDHTGDVGGSSSPEDEEEESYFSALSDVEITEHPEAYLKMTTKALKAASGKSAETHIWHPSEHTACRKHSYNQEEMVRSVFSNSEESSAPYKPGSMKPLSSRSMDDMKDISSILPSKDSQDSQNFVGISAIEKQPGSIERWELIQVQDLSNKLRMKQTWQQWQQLNSDLTNIDIWLDKMEEEMEGLQEAEPQPVSSIQAIEQRVKKLKDMFKAYNNYKALVLSVNLTSKDFKQADSTGCKELQNRLRRVNLRWEKANLLLENWKKNLQKALIHCQDFHEQNQKLLLWLAAAETRRHQAQVKDPNADPHRIQESRKELMQLEKELLERQLQVNALQEIAAYLLVKPDGEEYIEADEKVHVIGKKLKQLLEGVSCDLKVSQGSQDISAFLLNGEELDSGTYHQLPEKSPVCKNKVDGKKILQSNSSSSNVRMEDREETNPVASKKYPFFYRVLRVALPLQLFFLLLLFLASLIPASEEDYSCTQTNNFARSFYPMLRYINGPPPT